MELAYIGVGSNMGQKIDNCRKAVERVGQLEGCTVRSRSSLYRTEPVGVEDQDFFINGAFCLETDLSAENLLSELLNIETDMGRVRRRKWGERVIDLDILLFGTQIVQTPRLTVPHPLMHERRFVLRPMAEIAPDLRHPVLNKSMAELAENLPEEGQAVEIFEEY